jgi:hypothetical protein
MQFAGLQGGKREISQASPHASFYIILNDRKIPKK